MNPALHERQQRVRVLLDAARRRLDKETVHQLRVSIRRWQAALRWLGYPKESRAALRPLMQLTGEVRNRDIALELARAAGQDRTHPTVQQWTTERRAHAAALKRALTAFAVPDIGPEPAVGAAEFPKRLVRDFFRAGRRACQHPAAEQLHALRLAGKRLRYTIELMELRLDASAPARLRELKRVQDALGEINDCATAAAMTTDDALRAFLADRQRDAVERFLEQWHLGFGVLGAGESWRWFANGPGRGARSGVEAPDSVGE
jgi:CHAD domain-containing protein